MNRHQRREAKAARRRKRTAGVTRGKVRGPITRAQDRAERAHDGQGRYLGMQASITKALRANGVRLAAKRRTFR